jgi:DNA repair exonuclease SbcCD ATPase subunit
VGAILDPLTGDWNALDQKGEVLAIAGDAAQTAADNLTNALPTLLGQWEGGAAESFESYLTDLAAAISYEGPLNRVVGEIYHGVALIIREGARTVVQLIGMVVTRLRRYVTGTGAIELGGEVLRDAAGSVWDVVTGGDVRNPLDALREEWEEIKEFYDDAVAIVEMLQTLHSDVQEIIELARDPLGALEEGLRNRINEELEPLETSLEDLEEQGQQIEEGIELGQDLADLADVTDLAEAPAGGYDAGADPFRE